MPNNVNTFWKTPSNQVQKGDYNMAFYQPLSFTNSNMPEWNWHAPPFLSHWADDLHLHKPFQPGQKRNVTAPAFDIRETEKAYFLDGEFPGTKSKDEIKMHWTGKRTLVVEATVTRVDLEQEWGIVIPKAEEKETTTVPEDHGSNSSSSGSSKPKGKEAKDGEEGDEDLSLHRCLTNEGCDDHHHHHHDHDNHETKRANSSSTQGTQGTQGSSQTSQKSPTATRRPSLAPLKKRLSFATSSKAPKTPPHHSSPPPLRKWASERKTGSFKRTFAFPEDVDHDSLKARLNQGVLKVMIDKVEPMKPRAVSIDFSSTVGYFAD